MKGMIKGIKRTPHNVATKVGLSKKTVDVEFNDVQSQFSTLETATEKFIRDIKQFNEAATNIFTAGSGWATHFSTIFHPIAGEFDLLGKHPEATLTIKNVEGFVNLQEELRAAITPELELITSRIFAPMKEYREVLKSVRKTFTKRDHKLTDYDRFNKSLSKLRDKKEKTLNDEKNLYKMEQDFEIATNDYDAINNAMKSDLPRFMYLSSQFIEPLFNSFYYMQLNIFYTIVEKMTTFIEDGKLPVTSGQDIVEEYMGKRTDAYQTIENMNIIKKILSVSRLVQVARAQDASGKLSRSATTATTSSTSSSISRASTTTSRAPPTASSYKKAPPPPPSSSAGAAALWRNAPPPYSAVMNGGSSAVTSAAARRPPPPPPIKPKPKPVQYVVALYDFAAQADGDLSFRAGDRIEVVERSDSTDDWWTGRLHGQQGVFPGNYVQDA